MLTKADRTAYEAEYLTKESSIQQEQEAYFSEFNKYRQKFSDGPREEEEPTLDGAKEVHVYDGPQGKGYIVVLEKTKGRDTYRKHIDYGPEGRNKDWTRVVTQEEIDGIK